MKTDKHYDDHLQQSINKFFEKFPELDTDQRRTMSELIFKQGYAAGMDSVLNDDMLWEENDKQRQQEEPQTWQ